MNIQYNQYIQPDFKSQDQYQQNQSNDLLKHARKRFIKKIYSIVTVQLIITSIVTAIAMAYPNFRYFQTAHYELFIINLFIMICIQIGIFCSNGGRQYPINYILLGAFTICESYVVSWFCSQYYQQYGGDIILQAIALTAVMVGSLTILAFYIKKDFTIYLGLIFVLGISLFLFGIMLIFSHNEFLYNVYLFAGTLFFGFYLVIDTQLIMGGKKYSLTLDDYVIGALFLYIDIIALFIRILIILGKLRDGKRQ